jgi:hypothetical protein
MIQILTTKYGTYSIYLEYHSVRLLIRIGTPTPLSQGSVSPPEPRGGHTRLRVKVWGGPQFRRPEKKPSTLSTLLVPVPYLLPVPIYLPTYQYLLTCTVHICEQSEVTVLVS